MRELRLTVKRSDAGQWSVHAAGALIWSARECGANTRVEIVARMAACVVHAVADWVRDTEHFFSPPAAHSYQRDYAIIRKLGGEGESE